MTKIENSLAALQERLGDADIYSEARKNELAELLRQEGEFKSRADALEETWLELQEEIEQVQALAVD